jgi:serine protease Do
VRAISRILLAFLLAVISTTAGSSRLQAQAASAPGSYLGIQMTDIDTDRAARLKLPWETGVEVTAIEEDSPAAKAGIRPGDALLTYNGETILGAQQLIRLVRETPAGRRVRVQIWRDNKSQTLTLTTAPAPAMLYPPASFASLNSLERRFPFPDIPMALLVWKNPMLGIECEGVSPQLAEFFGVKNGILIRSVDKGTSGEKAGLRAGDILVSIDGRPVYNTRDLNSFRRNWDGSSRTIPVSIVRNRKPMNLQITLTPAPGPE